MTTKQIFDFQDYLLEEYREASKATRELIMDYADGRITHETYKHMEAKLQTKQSILAEVTTKFIDFKHSK